MIYEAGWLSKDGEQSEYWPKLFGLLSWDDVPQYPTPRPVRDSLNWAVRADVGPE